MGMKKKSPHTQKDSRLFNTNIGLTWKFDISKHGNNNNSNKPIIIITPIVFMQRYSSLGIQTAQNFYFDLV